MRYVRQVLTLFGHVAISGEPITRPKVARLLSVLALHRNRFVSASALSEAAWPGEPENPNRLRVTISRIRSQLTVADSAISVDWTAAGYRLSVPDRDTDVGRFEQKIIHASNLEACRDALEEWSGEPYLDLSDFGDGYAEAERLRRLRLQRVMALAERLLLEGHPAEALEALDLLLPVDLPDERVARLEMQAWYRLGRPTEALAVVQRLRHQLAEQFGLEVSPSTRAIELAVLRHDLDPRHELLVGRDEDSRRFDGLLLEAGVSGLPITIVRGVSGVGKTRLATVLLDRASEAGFVIAQSQCHEDELSGRYRSAVSLLRDSIDVDLGDSADADPAHRLRTFDRIAAAIHNQTPPRPILWLLDDAQWADESSLALLLHILRSVPASRFAMLLTVRTDVTESSQRLTAWFGNASRVRRMEFFDLAGLSPTDLRELAAHAGRPIDEAQSQELYEATDGLPFLAIELLQADPRAEPVPPTIEAALSARLARVPDEGMAFLQWLSVCPHGAELSLLVAAIGRKPEDMSETLENLERSGLVHTRFDGGRVSLFLVHDLLRRHIKGLLGIVQRSSLHIHLSDLCEERGATTEAAFHAWSAGSAGIPDKAVERCRLAAAQALRRTAYEDALLQLDRAIEASSWWGVSLEIDRAEDAQTWLLLAQARHRLGDAAGRRSAAERACRCARLADDWSVFALAALEHGGIRSTYGLASIETMTLLDEAILRLPPDATPLRARVMARAGQEAYHVRDFARSQELTGEADRTARALGDPSVLAVTLEGTIWSAHRPHRLAERLAATQEMVALAVTSGQRETELIGRIWRACAWLEIGDLTAIDFVVRRGDADLPVIIGLSDQLRVPSHEFRVLTLRSTMAAIRCNESDAFAFAERALEVGTAIEPLNAEQSYAAQLLPLLRDQNMLAAALPLVEPMVDRYRDVAGWRCAFAFVLAEAGEHTRARLEIEALATDHFAAVPHDLAWLMAMSFLADTVCTIGANEHASTLLGLIGPFGDRHVGLFDLAWNGAVAHYIGRLHVLLGDTASGIPWLLRAEKEHEKANSPSFIRRTREVLATCSSGSARRP